MSSMARSTGRASRLKNSRTPRQSPRSRIGTAKAACRPASSAAGRRRNSGRRRCPAIHSGCALGPDAARQAGPALQGDLPVMASNRDRSRPGRVQSVGAAQPLRMRVHSPEHAEVPVQALADRLEDLRAGLAERVGLGQHAGRLVLRRQPPLGLLAPGDVVEDDHAALDRAVLVPQRAAGHQDPGPVLAAGIGDVELRLVDRLAAHRPHQRQIRRGIEGHADRAGRSRNAATTPRAASSIRPWPRIRCAAGLKTRNRPSASATTTPSPMQSRTDWRIRVCSRRRQLGASQLLRVLLEALLSRRISSSCGGPQARAVWVARVSSGRRSRLGRVEDRSAWPPGGCPGPRR